MSDQTSPSEMAFDAVAFDLVDKCGRTFPLLLHYRSDECGDNGEGEGYIAAGALVSRDSAHTMLATIDCGNQWSAALEMTDESASFFATYAPHRDVKAKDIEFWQLSPFHNEEPPFVVTIEGPGGCEVVSDFFMGYSSNDEWVSLWAAANQPGACEHASSSDSEVLVTQTRERGRVVLEELHTLCCAASKLCSLQPAQFSLFSAYHPPALVRSFTVAALSPVLLSVPSDVLGIIADYAWLELPYVPLSPVMESEWWSSAFKETVDDLEEDMGPDEDEGEEDAAIDPDDDGGVGFFLPW